MGEARDFDAGRDGESGSVQAADQTGSVIEGVLACIKNAMDLDENELEWEDGDPLLYDHWGMDSMELVDVLRALQEEFQIKISTPEFQAICADHQQLTLNRMVNEVSQRLRG